MASVSNSNLLPVYTCVTQALLVHGPAPDLSVPNPTANQVLEALLAGKLEYAALSRRFCVAFARVLSIAAIVQGV